ncbi:MFS transporter [Micromonospora sp. STR1s_5]|nr:MFS transporter [Micromonospora sp. STR1s_5]
MLAVLFLARTVMGFQFQTIASTEGQLRRALGIGFAEIGTLIGLYMLPGILLALPGGLLVRRFGDKLVCCTGLGLMGLGGALVGLGYSFEVVLAGRLLSGIGGVFLSLAITKMVTDWFAGREMVVAMSVMLTSWPFGIAAGLVLFAPLAEARGWATVMYTSATASLVALLLIAGLYRSPAGTTVQAAPGMRWAFALPPRAETVPILVAGLAWGVFNLGLVMLFSFAPTFLAARGYRIAEAAFVASTVLWLMIATMPLGGYWLQGRRATDPIVMMLCAGLGLVMASFAFLPDVAPALGLVLACLMGPPPGALMAMPGRVLRPENRASGLGLFLTVYFVVMAVGPAIAGILRDGLGPSAPILFGAAMFIAIAPLVAVFGALTRPAQVSAVRPAS